MGKFYENLYLSKSKPSDDIEKYLSGIHFNDALSEDQKLKLDEMPNLKEFENVLSDIKENKTPGLDGLPIEFYKAFWDNIKFLYLDMIRESWDKEILPVTTRTSVLSTIHKADSRKLLSNYRPLSIANYDYKIAAFVFAKRNTHSEFRPSSIYQGKIYWLWHKKFNRSL